MANTGFQRSLTLEINKTVAGSTVSGYPITYSGLAAFPPVSPTFSTITSTEMAEMSDTDFNTRLAAFKAYVESVEAGLDVDATTVPGSEAHKENLGACPLPY